MHGAVLAYIRHSARIWSQPRMLCSNLQNPVTGTTRVFPGQSLGGTEGTAPWQAPEVRHATAAADGAAPAGVDVSLDRSMTFAAGTTIAALITNGVHPLPGYPGATTTTGAHDSLALPTEDAFAAKGYPVWFRRLLERMLGLDPNTRVPLRQAVMELELGPSDHDGHGHGSPFDHSIAQWAQLMADHRCGHGCEGDH
jgi:hypothetical protein